MSAPRFEGPIYDGAATVSLGFLFGISSFVVFRWVFIEIEFDLFVDYKTSFGFVLAIDAVSSRKHITSQFSFATQADV